MKVRSIYGVKGVIRNLKKQGKLTAHRCSVGLKRAGLFLQREALFITPIEWGALRGSSFSRAKGKGWNTVVRVGYTADYALYVHEMVDNYHRPPTSAKFLEMPATVKRPEMFAIIEAAGKDRRLKL